MRYRIRGRSADSRRGVDLEVEAANAEAARQIGGGLELERCTIEPAAAPAPLADSAPPGNWARPTPSAPAAPARATPGGARRSLRLGALVVLLVGAGVGGYLLTHRGRGRDGTAPGPARPSPGFEACLPFVVERPRLVAYLDVDRLRALPGFDAFGADFRRNLENEGVTRGLRWRPEDLAQVVVVGVGSGDAMGNTAGDTGAARYFIIRTSSNLSLEDVVREREPHKFDYKGYRYARAAGRRGALLVAKVDSGLFCVVPSEAESGREDKAELLMEDLLYQASREKAGPVLGEEFTEALASVNGQDAFLVEAGGAEGPTTRPAASRPRRSATTRGVLAWGARSVALRVGKEGQPSTLIGALTLADADEARAAAEELRDRQRRLWQQITSARATGPATNLATTSPAMTNLAMTNLAMTNLAMTNLAMTNLAMTNLATTNPVGTNLASTNPAGPGSLERMLRDLAFTAAGTSVTFTAPIDGQLLWHEANDDFPRAYGRLIRTLFDLTDFRKPRSLDAEP